MLQVVLPYLRTKLDRLYAQHSRGREALPGLGVFQRRCLPLPWWRASSAPAAL